MGLLAPACAPTCGRPGPCQPARGAGDGTASAAKARSCLLGRHSTELGRPVAPSEGHSHPWEHHQSQRRREMTKGKPTKTWAAVASPTTPPRPRHPPPPDLPTRRATARRWPRGEGGWQGPRLERRRGPRSGRTRGAAAVRGRGRSQRCQGREEVQTPSPSPPLFFFSFYTLYNSFSFERLDSLFISLHSLHF
ncbi:hypothetical protein D1007_12072 [Hordeum vulgare]|nr:hypothetical protein D1007_12072 [Hordeum vulgare]